MAQAFASTSCARSWLCQISELCLNMTSGVASCGKLGGESGAWRDQVNNSERLTRSGFEAMTSNVPMDQSKHLSFCLTRLHSIYLLSGSEVYGCERVCRALKQSTRPDFYFRRWLLTHADGMGAESESIITLYAVYHAVRLQQCFLRMVVPKVERRSESASRFRMGRACAGSYALWTHLCQNGGVSWKPGDIDIFLETESDMKMALMLYEDIVGTIANIDVYETSEYWKRKAGEVDCDVDTPTSANETSEATRILDSKLLHSYLPEALSRVKHGLKRNLLWLDALRSVAEHLPDSLTRQSYTVTATRILKAWVRQGDCLYPLSCLSKINLIQIGGAASGTHDFPSQVCKGFDMEHCCFFLEVDDELVSHCSPVGDALACANMSKIVLRSPCFGMKTGDGPADAIVRQLWRIIKYRRRGFVW